jgi:hypothetical protein
MCVYMYNIYKYINRHVYDLLLPYLVILQHLLKNLEARAFELAVFCGSFRAVGLDVRDGHGEVREGFGFGCGCGCGCVGVGVGGSGGGEGGGVGGGERGRGDGGGGRGSEASWKSGRALGCLLLL